MPTLLFALPANRVYQQGFPAASAGGDTPPKSSISLTGEVIITEGNKVPSAVAGSACAYGVGFLLRAPASNNVLGYPFEIFDFANG